MSYSAQTFVADEQPTTAKWNLLWSNDASFNDGSGFANGAIGSVPASLADGLFVQASTSTYSAVATGTGTIPNDDTIPQNTEGDEYMTVSITPKSATNILLINVAGTFSVAGVLAIHVALFRDSTANAIAATGQFQGTSTGINSIVMQHQVVAGSTSSTTFKIRAGASAAATTTFNGQGGNRRFGAISKSSITVIEYKAS